MNDQLWIDEIFSSIQGEGFLAGRRQIFIRLAGCNLDCIYCDSKNGTRDICRVETKPGSGTFLDLLQPLSLVKVLEIVAEWLAILPGAHHSISFTGGEPLLYSDILAFCIPDFRRLLPIHLETNGVLTAELEQVIGFTDYISMDMKLPSTAGCTEQLWENHRQFLNIAQTCQVSVKIVVADNTLPAEVHKVCDIISAANIDTPLFIQPLTLTSGDIGISSSHLLRLQEVASSLLQDVRVMPQMHKYLNLH